MLQTLVHTNVFLWTFILVLTIVVVLQAVIQFILVAVVFLRAVLKFNFCNYCIPTGCLSFIPATDIFLQAVTKSSSSAAFFFDRLSHLILTAVLFLQAVLVLFPQRLYFYRLS